MTQDVTPQFRIRDARAREHRFGPGHIGFVGDRSPLRRHGGAG